MEVLINNPAFLRRLIRRRRETRADRYDEVWDGVYVVAPLTSNEHQEVLGKIYYAIEDSIGRTGLSHVYPGVNISDRGDNWRQNYRCPDVVAFLPGNPAVNKRSHYLGGPDIAVEIVSPRDRSRQKFDFYAKVGVRELLLVDRKPWALELYRLENGVLTLAGRSNLDRPDVLVSQVLPLSFQLVPGEDRPSIEITHADGVQRWSA
jgi:Uma2 family endonuclease